MDGVCCAGYAPHVRRAQGNVDVQHVDGWFSVAVTHALHRPSLNRLTQLSFSESVPHERFGRGSEARAADVPCMMLCTCRLARISLLSRLGGLPELALSGLITLGQAGSSPKHPIVAHSVRYTVLRGVAVARERDGQRNTFAKWGVGCGRLLLAVCGVQVA